MKHPSRPSRATRISVTYQAVLTTADGHDVDVVIKDVSASGFRIEVCEELLVGEHVQLRIGRGDSVAAQIKWALGKEAGGVFLEGPERQ